MNTFKLLFELVFFGGIVVCFVLFVCFSKQGFSVTLKPVLKLILIDHAGLKLKHISLPLPLTCWDVD